MSETLLSLDGKLIDETGVYEDMDAILADRLKRWRLSSIDPDNFPETYTPGEQDDEIYARWGHTAQVTVQMVDLLRAHDCALRLNSASNKAPRTASSKFRL